MPLNSTQVYLKGLLNGLPLPMQGQGNLTAYIQPPDPGDIVDPLLYIWGSTTEEKRQTMPRAQYNQPTTGGFKKIQYQVDMWLYAAEQADDPDADSLFPSALDAVTAVLRNTPMGLTITDQVTGQQSKILEIGEDIKTDYAPVRAAADQALMIYMARFVVKVTELIQG